MTGMMNEQLKETLYWPMAGAAPDIEEYVLLEPTDVDLGV